MLSSDIKEDGWSSSGVTNDPNYSYNSYFRKLNFGSLHKSSSGPTFMFVLHEETLLVSVLPKNRWKGVKMEQGLLSGARTRSNSEIYEIPPKNNKNLFVVQLVGQSSRLSGEAVNYPTLEKSKHCLGAVLGKLFQLCGQLD